MDEYVEKDIQRNASPDASFGTLEVSLNQGCQTSSLRRSTNFFLPMSCCYSICDAGMLRWQGANEINEVISSGLHTSRYISIFWTLADQERRFSWISHLPMSFGGKGGLLRALWAMVVSLLHKGPWMNSDECNSDRGFHCSMPFHGMVADL